MEVPSSIRGVSLPAICFCVRFHHNPVLGIHSHGRRFFQERTTITPPRGSRRTLVSYDFVSGRALIYARPGQWFESPFFSFFLFRAF